MEERITEFVDTRVNNAIRTICQKVDKSYAEAVVVQPRNVGATSKDTQKSRLTCITISEKSFELKGIQKTPRSLKPRILSPLRMK